MPRRLHTPLLQTGLLQLDRVQAHHAKNVLRLSAGDAVEVFDDAGRCGAGLIEIDSAGALAIRIAEVHDPGVEGLFWTVAAAVPKGERADWMVEKLSELGCAVYIPLLAARSVVQPKGTGKHDRWVRLAIESAKQCRRQGVMRIESPATLPAVLESVAGRGPDTDRQTGWFLDTGDSATPVRELLLAPPPARRLTLLIGPEGGWTSEEIDQMLTARLTAVSLTATILRIESAAVAAAACVAAIWA